MSPQENAASRLSRRALLKNLGLAPLALHAAAFQGESFLFGPPGFNPSAGKLPAEPAFAFSDARLIPHYPSRSPLEDVLRLVTPGLDGYMTEKYAFELDALVATWAAAIKRTVRDHTFLTTLLDPAIRSAPFEPVDIAKVRTGSGIEVVRRRYSTDLSISGREAFLRALDAWLGADLSVETVEFELTAIEEVASLPLVVRVEIRYDLVGTHKESGREERIGTWNTEWSRNGDGAWTAHTWQPGEETISTASGPWFVDVTRGALGATESYQHQLLRGSDYWRTVLDGACGIDVYGNNGVATGDYDGDGFDDLYICQPAGLPNRLYHNRGDGTFEDVTEKAGVGVLDNTACALFADFRNRGLQDLLVVCGSGPLLFLNQGNGTFALKRDAFRFNRPPQGSFTHAALADYDRDGRLDIYLCTYSYYLGLDQYHYPVPYFDARNGPANCLLHNEGDGTFVDRTEAAGLDVDNNRYSFACAWGESGTSGFPDIYVSNDFGRNNLYRNNGDGTFASVAGEAHVEDVGAGMSAAWGDVDNDGKPDIYISNMWSAAGQRVSSQARFHANSTEADRLLYKAHARGDTLYKNKGGGQFQNVTRKAGVEMGRWAWCSDFVDFDHDGHSDIYVTNGYISAPESGGPKQRREDLASFFWRQVVAKSPDDATPTLAYEHGWNALNELIRSDSSWSGHERNVLFANNRDGTFSEVSGPAGLNFPEDSRSFALADLDHDGRLEIVLKNRNAPQLRILHNAATDLGHSLSFRLRGTKSNRDAIGAAVTVTAGTLQQTKYLQAGSGFLAQHSKELFFGIGRAEGDIKATIRWPSGMSQELTGLQPDHRVEVEEGNASIATKPFLPSSHAYQHGDPALSIEPMPEQIGTWLIQPLKAPGFSLPDETGTVRELTQVRNRFVLLNFWSLAAASSLTQLRAWQRQSKAFKAGQVEILALNVDETEATARAKSIAAERFEFPTLLATPAVAGIYNILYRYLFDRRRDLALPTSFLLDKEGMIVKVYQGPVEPGQVVADVQSIPATPAERMKKALPFAGAAYHDSFQRNDFTFGVAMFQHGYLDEAAESFQQVVAAKPEDAEGYYNLGTLSLRRNDFVQARQYLAQTLKLRPNYPEAFNNLGMMDAQEGHAAEAIDNFQQALQLRPGYATALLNLGNVYRRQGSFDKAQDSLNRALQLQPDDPEINYSLGMFYAQQSQLQQAAEYLQKAVNLRPGYPEALNNLGVLFVREQDYAQAQQQFEHCIQINPDFDQSYLNLARLLAMRSDKAGAIDILQTLLQKQPQNATARQAVELLKSTP